MGRVLTAGMLAVALLAPAPAAVAGSHGHDGVSKARAGTARFHSLGAATRAGYEILPDAEGITCIDNPGVGGMGTHYVNGDLVADPTVRSAAPEALIYERGRNGRMRLVAVEYVVLQAAWHDAGNSSPPRLFGRTFVLVDEPNRYGLPAFYELHAWIWKDNPRGMFDDWNPRVTCHCDH